VAHYNDALLAADALHRQRESDASPGSKWRVMSHTAETRSVFAVGMVAIDVVVSLALANTSET
jgi:hypothetical protein